MTSAALLRQIRLLLDLVERAPNTDLPSGISLQEIKDVERRLGLTLPVEMSAFLRLSNGPVVGPGGLFGVHPQNEFLDIESMYDLHPAWRSEGWIPVAGDGCGNYYVALERNAGEWPVVFVEMMEDPDAPAFVVASGILVFLIALLEKDLGAGGWPFDRVSTLESDPEILEYADTLPLPWDS